MSGSAVIFDTSAVMALFLQEDKGALIEDELRKLLAQSGHIYVPPLFWYEAGNTLISALKRNRITPDELRDIETDLAELPIVTEPMSDAACRLRIRETALAYDLSYYDAAYLEMSRRLQIPLRSFDKRILRAAVGNHEIQ